MLLDGLQWCDNAIIGSIQESRAGKAIEALCRMVPENVQSTVTNAGASYRDLIKRVDDAVKRQPAHPRRDLEALVPRR